MKFIALAANGLFLLIAEFMS